MFGRLWNFVRRHRNKFFCLGVAVGGGYVALNYIRNKIQEHNEKVAKDLRYDASKQHHFDNVQRSCNITILEMIPNVQEAVYRCFNVDQLLSQLQHKCDDKISCWEQLKIQCVARLVSCMYACSLFIILQRMQYNVIAGFTFADVCTPDDLLSDIEVSLKPSHRKYLSLVQNFFTNGIPELCKQVQAATVIVLEKTSLKQAHTLTSLRREISLICEYTEGIKKSTAKNDINSSLVSKLFINKSMMFSSTEEDETFNSLVRTTEELIGRCSDLLQLLQDQSLMWVSNYLSTTYHTQQSPSPEKGEPCTELPLAKLIPVIARVPDRMCAGDNNIFVSQLLILRSLGLFSTCVYETALARNQQS